MILPIDTDRAIATLAESHLNGETPDFSRPCQSHPNSPKARNHKCKQVRPRMLIEHGWSLIRYSSLDLMTEIQT